MTAIFVGDTPIDLPRLNRELAAVVPEGVYIRDDYLYRSNDAWPPEECPPEAVPIVEAHDASTPRRTRAFESQEDAERLALVAERAQTDPAFAALAELALGKQQGGTP